MASADLGDVGSVESEPVEYFWNPLYNVIGVLAWVILAAAFAVFKENRTKQAFWILVPVIAIKVLWAVLAGAFDVPSSVSVLFTAMLDIFLVSFALIWLLADRLGRFNRFLRLLLEAAIFFAVLATLAVQFGVGFESLMVAIVCIIIGSAMRSSFSFARFICRKRFGAIRFCAWAAVWILMAIPLLFVALAAVQLRSLTYVMEFILQVLTVALIFAGVIIGGLLPFEVLLLANRFWRKRFEKLVGIPSRAVERSAEIGQLQEAPNLADS